MKHGLFFVSLVLGISVFVQGQSAEVGDDVPSFNFYDNGHLVNSRSFSGSVMVISFWASWCGPCRREIPYIQSQVYNKYKNDYRFKLLVIGVGETSSAINQYKYYNNLYLPMYADENKTAFDLFGGNSLPATYIIDTNGKVYYHSTGFYGDVDELLSKLEVLLN